MLFGGDKLYMIPSSSSVQCMGFLLSGGGKVIGIDACSEYEAEVLERTALALGGRVDCWFLTHAHFDHIGGLIELLSRGRVRVESVCYAFPPIEYIQHVEELYEPRGARVGELEALLKERGVRVLRAEKGRAVKIGHFRVIPLSDGSAVGEAINPSTVVYRVETAGDPILFLGDMDRRAEGKILEEFPAGIRCPVVQMAHHGQDGVSEDFYRRVGPKVCLWPTPEWLWNNDAGGGFGTGPFSTLETRAWMEKLHTVNYRFGKEVTLIE